MGEALVGGSEGAVASVSGGPDFLLRLPQVSQITLTGLGKSRMTRMRWRCNRKPRVLRK